MTFAVISLLEMFTGVNKLNGENISRQPEQLNIKMDKSLSNIVDLQTLLLYFSEDTWV